MLPKVLEALAEKSPELAIMVIGFILVVAIAIAAIKEIRKSYSGVLEQCREILKELLKERQVDKKEVKE